MSFPANRGWHYPAWLSDQALYIVKGFLVLVCLLVAGRQSEISTGSYFDVTMQCISLTFTCKNTRIIDGKALLSSDKFSIDGRELAMSISPAVKELFEPPDITDPIEPMPPKEFGDFDLPFEPNNLATSK